MVEVNKKKNSEKNNQQKELLTFLTLVGKGQYAKVEQTSLRYVRIREQREESLSEENFYYSMT